MPKKLGGSKKVATLRKKAEVLLRATERDVAAIQAKDLQQLVHELQVHQVELEMQNEELRKTQLELERACDRYADLYDFSPVGHLTLDMQHRVVGANLTAGTLLRVNRKSLIGLPLERLITRDHQDTFRRHCQEVLMSGTRQTCEMQLREEAGISRWVHFESLVAHDETGRITQWRTAFLDVSDRKRAEDEVRRSEAFINSILENLPNMVFVKDATDLKFVRFNKAGEDLLGYPRSELIGKSDYDFFPRAEADFFTAKDREVLTSGRMLDIPQEPIRTRSGETRYLHTKKIPIVGKEGTSQYLLGISEDITNLKRTEKALLLAKFSIDRAADAVYWIDPQAKILDVNEAASRMLGYSKEELCSMTVHDLNPDFQADMWPGFWAETQRRETMVLETAHRAKNGRLIPIEVSVNYLSYEGKEYHCAFVRDITERKIVDEALKASDAFTRAVLNSLSAHICVLDKKGVILKTNNAWKEFARRYVDDVYTHGDVGDKYLDCCRRTTGGDASTSQAILKGIEAVLMGDEPGFSAEYRTLSPEVPQWFLIRATPLKDSQGVVISHTDISERVRMTRLLEQHIFSLREKREELESLTKKLIDAREEENKRISRDLHDDFNQRLASLAVELESVERLPIAWPEPVARQLAMIRGQVMELSNDLHDLAYRLHPSLLDHVGLEIAARDHVAEFRKKTGLPVRFTARDVPGALPPEIATNLFRMMQESLQNVAKHAQATEVTVRLSGSSKGIGLSVCDNGKGFDLENKDERIKGLGLVSMQERARSLGGFLSIHSSEKTGTKVCAFLPRSPEGL